jgi:dihydroorotate dehydrogenase electron transfer subunit
VGYGTEEFSNRKAGETIRVLGPLGNGFPLDKCGNGKAVLIGGGIGIPPLLQLSKELKSVTTVVGYRDSDTFLREELEAAAPVVIATEDGSVGTKGNVIDAIRQEGLKPDIIYACGPTPMLRGVKAFAKEQNIPAWLSLEEKMACGIGACLACVCNSTEVDEHSRVHNKRICKDGPVFLATDIEL